MTTAPNIPLAMCWDIGMVEQWYIQIPARLAVKVYSSCCPGSMVRMGPSGASSPAWKSIEWPIVPWLTRVTWKVSPTRPCRIGPGEVPL